MQIHSTRFSATVPAAVRAKPTARALLGGRPAHGDPRWSQIVLALTALRARRRHSVRIVDADCGNGTLLIAAARLARSFGFTAIEARGIDGSPGLVAQARAAATLIGDPAIGVTFDLADMVAALAQEAEFPADIVLCRDASATSDQPGVRAALAAAGDIVIGDRPGTPCGGQAA